MHAVKQCPHWYRALLAACCLLPLGVAAYTNGQSPVALLNQQIAVRRVATAAPSASIPFQVDTPGAVSVSAQTALP